MDCGLSDSQRSITHRKGNYAANGGTGLLSTNDCTAVLHNDALGDRVDFSHEKSGQIRQVSLLASLLEPFANGDAENAALSLIDRFGSIDRALSASPPQLQAVLRDYDELGRFILAARELVETSYRFQLIRRKITPDDPKLLRYLQRRFKNSSIERLRCVFLGEDMTFLKEEEHARGCELSVGLHAGELVKRAYQLGAHGLILAHNHPSGHCIPSDQDRDATRGLAAILEELGLRLLDHLIFTEKEVFSFAKAGAL